MNMLIKKLIHTSSYKILDMLNQVKFLMSSNFLITIPYNLQRFSNFPSYITLKRNSTYFSLTKHLKSNTPPKSIKSNTPLKYKHKFPARSLLSNVSTNKYQFIKSFDDFDLHPQVLRAIKEGPLAHVTNPMPTPIQSLAIDKLLRKKASPHIVYAAETGSGKTLAYLVPIVEALKREDYEDRVKRQMGKPRAIILVPTHELVQQVLGVLKVFSHIVKISTLGLTAKIESKVLSARLENPVDVVVGTPTAMLERIKSGLLSAGETRFLVIDEADSLLEETKYEKKGWGGECRKLVDIVRSVAESKGHEYKIIAVTATLPKSIDNNIEKLFGSQLTKITTPALHKPLPNLKVEFVNLKLFNGNRRLALLQILKKSVAEDDKVMVFCNRRKTVEELHSSLAKVNINTLAIYKNGLIRRSEVLRRFQHAEEDEKEMEEGEEEDEKNRNSTKYHHHNIIICTDLAARGIDTMAVNHVILYDFPTSVVDYLHRVGRTARAGSKPGCRATALVGNKDRILADRIWNAVRQKVPLTQ